MTTTTATPRISVVIPAYNEEKNIGSCLKALSAQSVKPYEIIVANNNSTDNTATIAHEYKAKVILATEQGYVFALKTGMNGTSGDVVAVVDADTLVPTNWIEIITQTFSDPTIVGATGSIHIKNGNFLSRINDAAYKYFLIINFTLNTPHLVGFNFAVRKTALNKINGLDTRYKMGPDVELGLRLRSVGKVIYVDDMIVYPSMRRWEESPLKTFIEYARSYIWTVLLKKPAAVKQKVIR
jgi:glycosyltransferase involved in cell wall biosynthesis